MKLNQRDRILKYIAEFGSITSYQAYEDLGITQLGARIKELKELGYQFKTVAEKGKNRFKEPVHYVRYFLIKKVS